MGLIRNLLNYIRKEVEDIDDIKIRVGDYSPTLFYFFILSFTF